MKTKNEFVEFLLDQVEPLGDVSARAMFGGHGITCDDLMFGLVSNGDLYLKVDDHTREEFEGEGLVPFTYVKKGKEMALSYYSIPGDALDNPARMLEWARKGHDAALRARVIKKRKPKPTKKKAKKKKKRKS